MANSTISEIKKCPFCGSKAVLKSTFTNVEKYFVQCGFCKARTDSTNNEFIAINLWNKRMSE